MERNDRARKEDEDEENENELMNDDEKFGAIGEEEEEEEEEEEFGAVVEFQLIWNKTTLVISVPENKTFLELQHLIYERTNVLPGRQKIFGIKFKGLTSFPDGITLAELSIKQGQKVKMMGTAEQEIRDLEDFHSDALAEADSILDDFELDYIPDTHTLMDKDEADRALMKMISKAKINIMNPPRKKRLLVLDLDHTLLHFSRHKLNTEKDREEMKRPYMEHFLEKMYRHYDLAVWSQTKWTWVEIKLTELGFLSNPKYAIAFALDHSVMFKVTGFYKGSPRRHKVKPLGLIWSKFPQWNETNTVHIDDLARNFALNPQQGLQCTPFKRNDSTSYEQDEEDRELLDLARYLEHIAENHSDFSTIDHSKWKSYLTDLDND